MRSLMRWSWWRSSKISKSLLLLLLAVAFSGGAMYFYPAPGQLPTPSFATIQLQSTFPIASILYEVTQSTANPSIANIKIFVQLPSHVKYPPPKAAAAILWLEVPSGISFTTCHDACSLDSNDNENFWRQTVDFVGDEDRENGGGETVLTFAVRARNFGYAVGDVNASVAIPRVIFLGPDSTAVILNTRYDVTWADSYEWSTFQPQTLTTTEVLWDEPVTSGVAQGLVAGGINQANESKDNTKTFIAGALIGLAGGALLAAFQEWLHRNDGAATEKAVTSVLQTYLANQKEN